MEGREGVLQNMRVGRAFKWLAVGLTLVLAGWVAIGLLLGVIFFLEDERVDREPSSLLELPTDLQRVFPPGARNIYRAWYKRGQTFEQFCRFELPAGDLESIELWLLGNGASELHSGTARGNLPVWFPGEETPDWWQITPGAEVVYYQFFNGSRYVDAVVQPSHGNVWMKLSKI